MPRSPFTSHPNVASFGRLGGEEFGLIWEATLADALREGEIAISVVESLTLELADGAKLRVTVSAGLAAWPGEGTSREDALQPYERADVS